MAGAVNVDPRRAGAISALMGAVSFGTGALASAAAGVLHDGAPRPMAGGMFAALGGAGGRGAGAAPEGPAQEGRGLEPVDPAGRPAQHQPPGHEAQAPEGRHNAQ